MKRLLIATSLCICAINAYAGDQPASATSTVPATAAAPVTAAVPTPPAQVPVKGATINPHLQALIDQYPNLIKRIQPLGKNCLESDPCPLAAAALGPSVDGQPRAGDAIFNSVCTNCHGSGLLGSPKLGDKAAWGPRIAKGLPTLYTHAISGFNAMPARGGNSSLTDAELKNAVDYMTSKSK